MAEKARAELTMENATELLTLDSSLGEGALGIIRGGAIAMASGEVLWVGTTEALDSEVVMDEETERVDVSGCVVMPGLVDCHTHLVFAGSRQGEFEQRVAGATYAEIAARGGGIVSTMTSTRAASQDTLLDLALYRLSAMLEQGVTTCEIKSGYGLSLQAELKILEVVQTLGFAHAMDVVPTFLGAHSIPPEFKHDRAAYIQLVVDQMIPAVAKNGLAEFCDVFCEEGVFSVEESRLVLGKAKEAGLTPRVHAEQLTPFGGARLAAEVGASSADHLEYVDDGSLEAMRSAGTVATVLPGAAFFLGQAFPDARRIADAGVSIAVASDFNPGSSPTMNLMLCGTMAAVRCGLSPAEVIQGMTSVAARVLGRADRIGCLRPGMAGDAAVFDVADYRTLLYNFGKNHCSMVVKGGELVHP